MWLRRRWWVNRGAGLRTGRRSRRKCLARVETGLWLRHYSSVTGFLIEPVVVDDAEWAARRWRRGENLSLADRLCLALAERIDMEILTADRAWGTTGRVNQVR